MKYYLDKTKHIARKQLWSGFKTAIFLAFKSTLRGNRWALVLIVIVLSFSFVNLVFVSSLIAGVITSMDNQVVNAMVSNVVISPEEDDYYLDDVENIEATVLQLPEVAATAPRLISSALIEYRWKEKVSQSDKGKSGTWEVVGVDPLKEEDVTIIHESLIEGSYLDPDDRDQILLGIEIAGREQAVTSEFLTLGGVHAGDKVRLTYPNGIQKEYTVKGIFRAREMMRVDHQAYVTRKELSSVLDRHVFYDRASEILVKTREGVSEPSVIAKLQEMGVPGQIRTWDEYGGSMRGVMSTFEIIGGLIGGVGLVVAAAVMFIVIYINVIGKRRQIGILRAIGIPQRSIIVSYLLQSLFYVVMGVILGWLLVQFVVEPYFRYYPLDLPTGLLSLTVEWPTMLGTVMGLFIAGVLAGLIPAYTIMRQKIIKIIWGN